MSEDTPYVDPVALVGYIRAVLQLEDTDISPELITRVLDLEMEFLQHVGIAEKFVDDPRPE